jgi:hypothetical protein
MKSLALLIFFVFLFSFCRSQTQTQKDSLIDVMCKAIIPTVNETDTQRVKLVFEQHLVPFIAEFPQDKSDEIWISVFYRFQHRCSEFKKILDRLDPPQGDWKTVSERPVIGINKIDCRKILDHPNLTYLESTGDTVRLTIKGGNWIDNFKDGTYSRLSFHWLNDCEFEIRFIESNNEVRKNFSKQGDKYKYQILNKGDGYYDISVEFPAGIFNLFKIYY